MQPIANLRQLPINRPFDQRLKHVTNYWLNELSCVQNHACLHFNNGNTLFQPPNSIRVSLWLQWTLPRVVMNLYSRSAVDNSAVCVSAELEDLTASIDYIDTGLQMQYKIGAFNISHFTHR